MNAASVSVVSTSNNTSRCMQINDFMLIQMGISVSFIHSFIMKAFAK